MDSPTNGPVELEGDSRKRVCKACERCRVKKSKCDGKKPCGRCRNDDAICTFGGRKKRVDRVHPKGYVEVLERQQKQLVKGIQILYERYVQKTQWDGPQLADGFPPTHEILGFLGALEIEDTSDDEDSDGSHQFEEDFHQLRQSIAIKDAGVASTASLSGPRKDSPTISGAGAFRATDTQSEDSSVGTLDSSLVTPGLSPRPSHHRALKAFPIDLSHPDSQEFSGLASDIQSFSTERTFFAADGPFSCNYDPLHQRDFIQSVFEDVYLVPPVEIGEDVQGFA